MLAFAVLYVRVALARAGFLRILKTIKDERAVQAWRRGDSTALTERNVDPVRHSAERRALESTLLAYTAFLLALLSYAMHWHPLLTLILIALAVGLFILAVVQTPIEGITSNPLQVIGRNAPCPCGSGKRYSTVTASQNQALPNMRLKLSARGGRLLW